ncbi:class II glutamine amidotransferase [Mycobacterium sp. SMC-4]|uniref:class II glutamine amidotransferase n=1 Tax=Mycobacterium sp. SMC-4 TaxID=2857059 RepID=UPI003D082289
MCRLFGLHAGKPVTATFWLLEAPDSLAEQSHRNPDGTGLGLFDTDGTPVVRKQPMAAWQDRDFATEAREMTGQTFIAHVRYATTGAAEDKNTHPFVQDRRIFAHNGVVGDLDVLDARLTTLGVTDLVLGDTDSERVFALITAAVRNNGGDVAAGITESLSWLVDNVAISAVNILLATETDLWALRYPETHDLYLLDRTGERRRDFSLHTNRISAHSDHLADAPSVVFATERMDDGPWEPLGVGELVHVGPDLDIDRRTVLTRSPSRPLAAPD